MALLVPDVGENEIAKRFLNSENSVLKLYTNDYTPVEGSTVGSFIECAVAGYAEKTLTASSWSIISDTGSYAEQEFLPTTAVSCYGYFVTNAAETIVLWAERFTSAPFTMPAGGGSIKVTPSITVA